MESLEWAKLIATNGLPMVVLVWLVYLLFTRLIPKAQEDFRTMLTAQQEACDKNAEEQRKLFGAQMDAIRDAWDVHAQRQEGMFTDQLTSQRTAYLQQIGEQRKAFLEQQERDLTIFSERLGEVSKSVQGLADVIIYRDKHTSWSDWNTGDADRRKETR